MRHDLAEDRTRDGMLRPSPNHGIQRLPNDDEGLLKGVMTPDNSLTGEMQTAMEAAGHILTDILKKLGLL